MNKYLVAEQYFSKNKKRLRINVWIWNQHIDQFLIRYNIVTKILFCQCVSKFQISWNQVYQIFVWSGNTARPWVTRFCATLIWAPCSPKKIALPKTKTKKMLTNFWAIHGFFCFKNRVAQGSADLILLRKSHSTNVYQNFSWNYGLSDIWLLSEISRCSYHGSYNNNNNTTNDMS